MGLCVIVVHLRLAIKDYQLLLYGCYHPMM